jgi:hypothetical protein
VIQPCQVQARFAFSPTSLFYISSARCGGGGGAWAFEAFPDARTAHSPGHFDLWPFDITILITARKINHPMTRNVCREMRERTVQHHRRIVCCGRYMGNHFIALLHHQSYII